MIINPERVELSPAEWSADYEAVARKRAAEGLSDAEAYRLMQARALLRATRRYYLDRRERPELVAEITAALRD